MSSLFLACRHFAESCIYTLYFKVGGCLVTKEGSGILDTTPLQLESLFPSLLVLSFVMSHRKSRPGPSEEVYVTLSWLWSILGGWEGMKQRQSWHESAMSMIFS